MVPRNSQELIKSDVRRITIHPRTYITPGGLLGYLIQTTIVWGSEPTQPDLSDID